MSQQINLFDPKLLKKKKYFSVQGMSLSLSLIVLGTVVFYGYARFQVDLLGRQVEQAKNRYSLEQLRLSHFSNSFSPEVGKGLLQSELKKLAFKVAVQQEILATLQTGELGNAEGYSEYMRAFARQIISGLWLTGFYIEGDGTQISLQGATLSSQLVPSYIQGLGREQIMHGKSFSYLQIQQPKTVANQISNRHYLKFSMQSHEMDKEVK